MRNDPISFFFLFLQKRANYKSTQLLQLRQKDISYLFVFGGFHKLRWQDFVHYWPPTYTYPLLTFMTEFPYCNWGKTCIPLTFPVPPIYLVLSTHFVNEPLIFICLVTQKYRVEELKVVITRLVSFMIERVIFFKQELCI